MFFFKRLLGICGSVGSGKSSLISSLLGQLRINTGSLGIDGKLAYVPQQAWIFHDSIRENILFGTSWDELKYNRGDIYVLWYCASNKVLLHSPELVFPRMRQRVLIAKSLQSSFYERCWFYCRFYKTCCFAVHS